MGDVVGRIIWRFNDVLGTMLLLALALALVLGAPAFAQQTPGETWEELPIARVERVDNRILVDLSENTRRSKALRVVVKSGQLDWQRLVIEYATGQVHFEEREPTTTSVEQLAKLDVGAVGRTVTRMRFELSAPTLLTPNITVLGDLDLRTGVRAPTGVSADDRWIAVPVYYGTTRAREADRPKGTATLAAYGARQAEISLGRAVVTVPIEREPGTIPRPSWVRLIFDRDDPTRDFTISSVEPLSVSDWRSQLRQDATRGQRFNGQALIFIHGFNVSFDDALFRTAQITHDVGFDGVSVLYSWPSRGNLFSYVYDLDSAKAARGGLKSLMEAVAATPGVARVNVIAHSLGNDPLLEVLREHRQMLDAKRAPDLKLNEVIFAAPDVSRTVFEQFADRLTGVARGMTLYASSNDRALMTSYGVRGGHIRAGAVPPEGPIVVRGVETLDVSKADTSWFALNHTTFSSRGHLIEDIKLLFEAGVHPPDRRFRVFRQTGSAQKRWWQYVPN